MKCDDFRPSFTCLWFRITARQRGPQVKGFPALNRERGAPRRLPPSAPAPSPYLPASCDRLLFPFERLQYSQSIQHTRRCCIRCREVSTPATKRSLPQPACPSPPRLTRKAPQLPWRLTIAYFVPMERNIVSVEDHLERIWHTNNAFV